MDKNKLKIIHILVAVLIILINILIQLEYRYIDGFSYEIINNNKIISSMYPVNESIWESLKLSFYPIVILGVIEYSIIGRKFNNFIEAKVVASFLMILFTTCISYIYICIFGYNVLLMRIFSYIVSCIIAQYLSYMIMSRRNESIITTKILSVVIIVLISSSFTFLTFNTPYIHIFKDPITGQYGCKEEIK